MKPKNLFLIALIAAAAAAGWFAAKHQHQPASRNATVDPDKIYSCSMHPQVRSTQPGKCPFCGMALAPLGQLRAGATNSRGSIMLSSNRISVINVQTTEVRRQPIHRTLRVAGTIDDNDATRRVLSAYLEGRIDRLYVNYLGGEVVQGEPLATLYSPMLLTAEREYQRLARQTPSADFPDIQKDYQRLLAGAAQRLRQLGLSAEQIEALPKKAGADLHTEILAPIAGTVISRFVYEGQYVKEGEKLFELADFSTMWFRFDVYERDLPWLKRGQTVEISTPAVPGKVYSGAIGFIEPSVNEPTRSAKVRVEIENPLVDADGKKRRELSHKLYAEGLVRLDAAEAFVVPRSAILSPGGSPFVYVDKGNGTYEQRRLKLGRIGDEVAEVLGGVKEGEAVVTVGNMLIDAEAQLNQASIGETGRSTELTSLPPLTEAQQKIAAEFLSALDGATAGLAADKFDVFHQQVSRVSQTFTHLTQSFSNPPPSLLQKLDPGSLAKAANLQTARSSFRSFNAAALDFIKAARAQEPFKSIKVYVCPMFPAAGQKSFWIQLQPPLRNPYFGAEMLDCGSEVNP
jgi:Cu(I)/Ag(I) efflux system membrane fusion protein